MFKLYALLINGEYETALYIPWFVTQRRPLRQVWLYFIFIFFNCFVYFDLTCTSYPVFFQEYQCILYIYKMYIVSWY